jgi:uncharacterized membrane protein YvbJ
MANKCPKCGLINPGSAITCDCGYNFQTKQTKLEKQIESLNPAQRRVFQHQLKKNLMIAITIIIVTSILAFIYIIYRSQGGIKLPFVLGIAFMVIISGLV